MGVDYYSCHKCGENFPDCGEYVLCESCYTKWCSEECAEEEGYVAEHCSKYNIFDRDDMEHFRENNCDYDDCGNCEYYEPDSCNYCRREDYEDYELLDKALELLDITREELIKKMKE